MRNLLIFCAATFFAMTVVSSCQDTPVEIPQEELEPPVVHITTEGSSVSIESAGGTGLLKYEIVNPQGLDSVVVSVAEDGEWLENVELEKFQTSGRVSFEATRNISTEVRSTVLTITYFYEEGKSVYAIANISQSCEIFDYNFSGKAAICRYWGRGLATYEYEVILGDVDYTLGTAGATYYTINFCDSIETEDHLPGAGNYHFPEESNMSEGKHIYTGYCSYYKMNASGTDYEEGPLQIWDGKDFTVEKDGDIYTIYGDLFDQTGKQHRIYYQGKMDLYDGTVLSDFKEDVALDLSGMHVEASIMELYGWSNLCSMYVVPDSPKEGDPIIRIELYVDADDRTLVTADYTPDDGMCNPFYFNGGHLWDRQYTNGTWIFSCENVQSDGMYDFGRPHAPFVGGEIDLTVNEDGSLLDLKLDVVDEQNNRFTGEQKGLPVTYF